MNRFFYFTVLLMSLFLLAECGKKNNTGNNASGTRKTVSGRGITKPGSTNSDTLTIFTPAAVFYYPDAVQNLHIRQTTDEKQYQAIMHEFEYLTGFSKKVLSQNWPNVPITDVRTGRYLRFVLKDHSLYVVDLDALQDPIGLLLCNGKKNPSQVDMANIESLAGLHLN